MERYRLENEIGEGAFGTVFRALKISNGQEVAMKRMKRRFLQWDDGMALREIRCLIKLSQRCGHPNIVEIYEVIRDRDDSLFLVFECMPENLLEFMQRALRRKETNSTWHIAETKIRSISRQILRGIEHLHKKGYVHRDVKPENILLRGDLCKVADFGLARESSNSLGPCTDYVTTRWYRAPEVCLRSPRHDHPVDMFALGCVMAELYNLYPLFPGKTELDQINMITKVLGCPTQQTWKEGLDLAERIPVKFARQTPVPLSSEIPTASTTSLLLLSQLLLLNPKQRITATNALAHEFFVVGDGPELTASSAEHRVVSVSPNMKNNASQLGSQSFVKAGSKRLQHAGFFAGVIVADDSPATIVNPYRTNRHIKARVEAK